MKITQRILFVLVVLIGFYPFIYFFAQENVGLLASKSKEVLFNNSWKISFYVHVFFGSIALLTGWIPFRFHPKTNQHKVFGKIYFFSSLFSGIGGLYLAFFANGGWISALGFLSLSLVWIMSTIFSLIGVHFGRIEQHKKWASISYSVCLGAITLRIIWPLLTWILQDEILAYQIAAYMSWIPNLFLAEKWMPLLLQRFEFKLKS